MNPVRFQITINGEPYFDFDDINALTLFAEEMPRRDEERISLYATARGESMQCLTADLRAGDEIVIKIVSALGYYDEILDVCSFCGRESSHARRLIAGKRVVICEGCVSRFSQALTAQTPLPLGAAIHDEPSWACGFCGNGPDKVPGVIVRNGVVICPECLRACTGLLYEGPEENRK